MMNISFFISVFFFFFQAEDGIRDTSVTGVQTCALPISSAWIRFAAVPPADAGRELGVWANLIHAEATLATGDRVTAAVRLAWAARAPGYKGLLAVRIDRLRSAAAADAAAAQEFLDRAIARCAHLGARRGLGLCYLSRASIGDQP